MKRRIKKKPFIILVASILTLIILIILIVPKKNSVLMLDFKDKNVKEIEDFCKINKCKIDIKYAYDIDVTKDKIIDQSIKANQEIDDNPIIVTVSKGIDYQKYIDNNVNELGRIPVMMYHGIHNKKNSETEYTGGNVDKDGYQRTSEAFIADLEFYYKSGYRMIRLQDYVNGIIDVEMGKSPIVLTFDDGLANVIKVTGVDNGNIVIDPNSAVGILESFKKKYPDYNVTATFFINGTLFHQPEYNDLIIDWLIENNYDIGNHTYGHANLSNISTIETEKEIGKMYQLLATKTKKYVNIVALPFGSPYSVNHNNFGYVLKGEYDGISYNTVSALRVGWESDYSPFDAKFNKYFIKRIRAYDNDSKDFDISYNFKYLETRRYISDGSAKTITIKKAEVKEVSNTNLKIISY